MSWLGSRPRWRTLVAGPAIIMLAHAVLAFVLASRMPNDVWAVSDPGAKLVAAENVLRHPSRPFEADLPRLPTDLANDWPQPYFTPHGDHAHPVTSQVFPILVAPFLAAFGLPGLLVVPILAWVAIGPLTARLAACVGVAVPSWAVMLVSVIGTPFVFYGLEFWEHTPAVACLLGAAVLILTRDARVASRILGGALGTIAIQLRPEMAPAVLAIGLVLILRRLPGALLALIAGASLVAIPLVAYNVLHFGGLASPHVGANLTMFSEGWWGERLRYATIWFEPARVTSTAAYACIAIGWLLAWTNRFRSVGSAVGLVAAMFLGFEMARGHDLKENFFRVFPIGLLALVPIAAPSRASRELLILILVPLVGCWLTAPNDGGFWGPRYLLPIVPIVLLLAVEHLAQLTRRSWLTTAAVMWFALAGLVVSIGAYRELRGTKRNYARMVHETAVAAKGSSYVLTSAWWVPAGHAGVLDARTTIVVETSAHAAQVLRAIAPAKVLVVSEQEAPGFSFGDAVVGTCYAIPVMQPHAAGRLQSARLSCK